MLCGLSDVSYEILFVLAATTYWFIVAVYAIKFSLLIQFAAHSKDLLKDKYTEKDTRDANRENDGYGL